MTRYERLLKEYEQVKALEFAPALGGNYTPIGDNQLYERLIRLYEEEIKYYDKEIERAKHLLKYMLEEDDTERKDEVSG